MFAQTSDPLGSHPHFTISQVSGRRPVHIGGIDTAGTVGANLGANWGLRDFQSIASDRCGQPHLVWADDNGTPRTQAASPAKPAPACAGIARRGRRRHLRPAGRPSFTG